MHWPAGREPGKALVRFDIRFDLAGHVRHEQRGPEVAFSVEALVQLQFRADCWPQEHLAWAAQTQVPSWVVLQQVVVGWTILMIGFGFGFGVEIGIWSEVL